ncbi:protein transport protein SEC13 [Nematocida sp. LUAm3]|nr:protein transport protein SEC13 [Nematocida sp. LUAm3]KAI5174064.1 protein transport protein SEC13 [Nematocida sp. LUAm2]KAI5177193.1 protein transport protein SEC13 [Nematocida sp. LUAm1]
MSMEQTENTLIYNLKVSEDGAVIAGAAEDGTVKLYRDDKEGPSLYNTLVHHKSAVFDVCFFKDKLISASYDGDIAFWRRDANSFTLDKSIHVYQGAINSLCAYEDKILCACSDGKIRILSSEGETLSDTFAHRYGVTSIFAWKNILVTGGMDGSVKVWNPQEMTLLKELKHHTAPVRDCKVSPNSFKLVFASCSEDGTAIIFTRRNSRKANTAEEEEEEEESAAEEESPVESDAPCTFRVERLSVGEPCTRVAWSKSGYALVVGYGEGLGKLFVPNGPIKWKESDALLP